MSTWFDNLREQMRVTAPPGNVSNLPLPLDLNNDQIPSDFTSSIGAIEESVISIASAVSGDVVLNSPSSSDLDRRLSEVGLQSNRLRFAWQQEYIEKLFIHNSLSICRDEETQEIFLSIQTLTQPNDGERRYTMNDGEIDRVVNPEDGVVGVSYKVYLSTQRELWRAADRSVSVIIKQYPYLKGTVESDNNIAYKLNHELTAQERKSAIDNLWKAFSQKNIGVLERMKFNHAQQITNIEEILTTVTQFWCRYYHVPLGLVSAQTGLKSVENQEVINTNLVSQCLRPAFTQLKEAVEYLTGQTVEVNYDGVLRGALSEQANTAHVLGQSGVYTINEIREKLGDEPVEGGDEFPNTAGAPATENTDNSEGEDNND